MKSLLLLLLSLLTFATAQAGDIGQLPKLAVGTYTSDKNGTLTGPYSAAKLPFRQTYKNTSGALQDSLAFTVQAFGPGYAQGLTQLFGPGQGVGPGAQDEYQLGELELPGAGSYLVQTNVFVYDRQLKEWKDGPSRVFWLFPLVPAPLPVELVKFTATATSAAVSLSWQTASERDVTGFEVQASADGQNFTPRLRQPATGGSTGQHYQASDRPPLARTYYRLHVLNTDGSSQYSPVVSVAPALQTSVYPNPATGQVHVAGGAGTTARLYNASGQLNREQLLAGDELLDLRGLTPGTYLLQVGDKRTRLATY